MANVNLGDAAYATTAGRFYTAPVVLTIGAGANVATPSALAAGVYRASCNALCYVRQGASNAIGVTASNGHPLLAATPELFAVGGEGDDYLAAFSAAGATLWLSRR